MISRRLVTTLWLLLAASACGGDGVSPASFVGKYTLATVDGSPVPKSVVTNPFDVSGFSVGDGSLTLSDGNRFSLALAGIGVTSGGVLVPVGPLICDGSYVVRGRTLDFQPQGGGCHAFSGTADASAGRIASDMFAPGVAVFQR